MEDGKNGTPKDGPSDEEVFTAQIVEQFAQSILPFAPELVNKPEELTKFAMQILHDQQVMAKIINDSVDPQARAANPWWGFHAIDAHGGKMTVKAPKEPRAAALKADHLFAYIAVLGIVSTPLLRAVLSLSGVRLEFFQAKAPEPEKPALHMV